jgi:hypothetical protein
LIDALISYLIEGNTAVSLVKNQVMGKSPLFRLYVKAFVVTGVPFAFMMLLFNLATGMGFRLGTFLFHMFFFGTLMSLMFISMGWSRLRRKGFRMRNNEDYRVIQEKEIATPLSVSGVYDKLSDDPYFGRLEISRDNGNLHFIQRPFRFGPKDRVTLSVTNSDSGTNRLRVITVPFLITRLVDYGNKASIERLEKLVCSEGT